MAAALVLTGAAAVAFGAPYFSSADGYLMPTKKNQTVPQLQGFAAAPKDK